MAPATSPASGRRSRAWLWTRAGAPFTGTVTAPLRRHSLTRALALAGMGATSTAVVLVGLLHVIPPSSDVNPARRTISEYALLETGWVFDTAVLALSAG